MKALNSYSVTLTNPHNDVTNDVYASRPNIVSVDPIDTDDGSDVVQITLRPEFDPERDYLVRVTKSGSRTLMRTLAGSAPGWASFPDAWKEWVPAVAASAALFVLDQLFDSMRAEDIVDLLEDVIRRDTSDDDYKSAWLEIADMLDIDSQSVVGTGSRTAITAIPLRIAEKLSKGRPRDEQWQAPLPRPVYHDPERSDRVLVVSSEPVVQRAVSMRTAAPSRTRRLPATPFNW